MATEPTVQGGSVNPADEAGIINIPSDQVHPAIANAPHPSQTQTYPVQINGRLENWTLERLTAEAQTGAAGREAFQDAAMQRKENAKALAVQEDLEQVFQGGEGAIDAFRRLGVQYKVPHEQIEQIAAQTFLDQDDEDDDDDDDAVQSYLKEEAAAKAAKATRSRPDGSVDYSNLSPDVQRVLRVAEKTRIDEIVKNALDSDEILAYNMEAQTPEGKQAIRDYVDEKIRGRLNSFNGDFGDGSRILAEVLPEIKTHLQALGTPGKRTHTGLGHAPGGGDSEVYPTKLPDHVSSTEGDAFEQNVLETLAYHQAQAERGRQQ